MKRFASLVLALGIAAIAAGAAHADEAIAAIHANPPAIRLVGPCATYTLLVDGTTADGQAVDLTRAAHYQVEDATIARVSAAGVVHAVGDGMTHVCVTAGGQTQRVRVEVVGSSRPRTLHFVNDVEPILGRFGCNTAGCHGAAEGQNGFRLSVFGFDPKADYAAIVEEARGRRVLHAAPEASLLLCKAAGTVPHGGGVRIPRGTPEYETLRAWIAAGTPVGDPAAPAVVAIRVEPRQRVLAMKGRQQLRVIARYGDGREVDATAHAKFQTNQECVASVAVDGLVSAGEVPGEVAVMASYMGAVDVFRAAIPRPGKIDPYPAFPANNFIDELVVARLRSLNVAPSELADDAEYLRRVHLDVIGTLPTPAEARRFFADPRPDKRARLVDALLERPEYADYAALQWSDLLRVDRQALGHKRAYALYRWIRESFAAHKPLDRFARELLTAEGPLAENAPAAFYKASTKPGETASTLAQVFLGVRIACAECHHHPFDRWAPSDYYGMQAFFQPLAVRPSARGEVLLAVGAAEAKNPRTGESVRPHALGAGAMPHAAGDRRRALAAWMTAPKNPWFARNLANRAWAHFFGRGLVDPVDDVRDTNPPSNPELLDALARHLVASGFDARALVRAITASRTYQLSSKPNATNGKDATGFSRAYFRRIDAEVLLDMVSQTTGVGERFGGALPGTRAVQLWDSKVQHYFLKLFGRPQRLSACDCERIHEPSVAQVLHLLNAPEIQAKLADERGQVAALVLAQADDAALVEELYLTFYSRLPTAAERAAAVAHLQRDPARRREAAEDVAWGLMNTLEFVFNH